MQKKRIRANNLLDKLHRGAVYTCMSVTLCGTLILGIKAYQYFTVVKPERKKAELQMITEGSYNKAEELKY